MRHKCEFNENGECRFKVLGGICVADTTKGGVMEEQEIKRGKICINEHDQLFIVVTDQAIPLSWNGEHAGHAWVGAVLSDGTYTLCAKPKLIANSFKEYVADFAADVGVKAAEVEVAALRDRLSS